VTATPILEALASEFSANVEHVSSALEMIDAGLSAPFIGRFRRGQVGGLSESVLRRLERRRQDLQELDRRRGTVLRLLEREDGLKPEALEAIRLCMDRFGLEDLFIPHRRPEPEVQLAFDRGLGALADLLVAPIPKEKRAPQEPAADAAVSTDATPSDAAPTEPASADVAPADAAPADAAPADAGVTTDTTPADAGATTDTTPADAGATTGGSEEATPTALAAEPDASSEVAVADVDATQVEAMAAPAADASAPAEGTAAGSDAAGGDAASGAAVAKAPASDASSGTAAPKTDQAEDGASHLHLDVRAVLNAHVARLCQQFVNPDRGIHTESEALAGALRILSDRLGRNARLRGTVRRELRKHGVLTVRPAIAESKAGRWKPLLKIRQPLRQLQGHRLLAIRQAQKERVLTTQIALEPAKILPKVRAALGKHSDPAHEEVLREVTRQALNDRLLPMVEQDVRLELKERADSEALRFLSQHLRQILFTPHFGPRPVVGVDVNARGDWMLALVQANGEPRESTEERPDKIDVGEKDAAALGAELATWLGEDRALAFGIGHGKGPRAATTKLRQALAAAGIDAFVYIVNESGLSSAANSPLARKELEGKTVPQRCAIGIGRRLQDPLSEILKVDPRHLGLGSEQGLVSKANARRVFDETIESCTAHIGGDVNRASLTFLQNLPGIDRETAKRLIARREERPFTSREELRQDGLLSEAQWANSVAFLRVSAGTEPLDATSLHPEQYPLVRRLLEAAGSTVEEGLGRMGSTRGLRRPDFEVDEHTWRDLMREIAHPGRDPRMRLGVPQMLAEGTDPASLSEGTVDGIVTNVASFGAFVDVGLPQDAMIHISEISDRYVRDARELLSIGQIVHARILGGGGQRLALSLKNVPRPVRSREGGGRGGRGERGERGERGGRQGGGGRGRRPERDAPRTNPNLRAAQTRRDGLGGAAGGEKRGRGRGGPGRGGVGRGGDRGRGRGGDEDLRLDQLPKPPKAPAYSPFANFFKSKDGDEPVEEKSGE